METLLTKKSELKALKPLTVKLYLSNTNSLMQALFHKDLTPETLHLLYPSQKVIHYLDSLGNDISKNTYINYIKCITAILKRVDSVPPKTLIEYQTLLASLNQEEAKQDGDGKMNEKQKSRFKPLQDLQHELTDKLDAKNVLLGLYVFQIPRRLEYRTVKVGNSKSPLDTGNWVIKKRDSLVFLLNDYKTSSTYGLFTGIVKKSENVKFYDYLKNLVDSKKPGDSLFTNNKNQPYSQAQFSKHISELSKKVFGSPLSLNDFRHIFISDKYKNKNVSLNDIRELAKGAGHSVEQDLAYIKN